MALNSPFDITGAKWGEVKQTARYHLAILPWGATEPHNYHLPYCTDMLSSAAIACEVAEKAAQKGAHAMVLPGNPLKSSAKKGARYAQAVVEKYVELVVELAMKDLY